MINLLPPETKTTLLYARRNRIILKWIIATCVGIFGIVTVIAAGYLYIDQSTRTYQREVERAKTQLSEQGLEETQARTKEISSNLKLAEQVLSRQVLFSKLLQQIGAAMPSGSILLNLNIGSLEGAIDLQAMAADADTSTQIQVNLEDPDNRIFEKADIISINCSDSGQEYPCTVSIRALFAEDSPFLFTSKTDGGKP